MANVGEPGGTTPGSSGTHPRMSAPLPTGPGGSTHTSGPGLSEGIGEAWQSARESVRQGAQEVAQRAQNFWTDARELVGRRPVAALAVAFCAGWAFGCLTASWWSRSEDYVAEGMSRSSA
jgi:hypothetical protein